MPVFGILWIFDTMVAESRTSLEPEAIFRQHVSLYELTTVSERLTVCQMRDWMAARFT